MAKLKSGAVQKGIGPTWANTRAELNPKLAQILRRTMGKSQSTTAKGK
jgi:hypothetical protein